jgi:hypothetical protein
LIEINEVAPKETLKHDMMLTLRNNLRQKIEEASHSMILDKLGNGNTAGEDEDSLENAQMHQESEASKMYKLRRVSRNTKASASQEQSAKQDVDSNKSSDGSEESQKS